MPPLSNPQQPRYAIQKARGKGWSTLEVGDALPQAEARFRLMVSVNPRAYFRLIQLDYNQDSDYAGTEFNWRLLQLHDPRLAGYGPGKDGGAPGGKGGRSAAARTVTANTATPKRRSRRGSERVRLPWLIYGTVIVLGLTAGALAYLLHAAAPAP